MQTLSANHNGQTTCKQLQWGHDNKNVFKNGYGNKERQTHMTCLNFREISNARVYMLCLVYMICNSGIMANSQWLRSIRLIFHLQANTKMKVDLEWCWFKKSIFFVMCNRFCNNLGQFLYLLQICAFFISKRSYYLVQNWPFLHDSLLRSFSGWRKCVTLAQAAGQLRVQISHKHVWILFKKPSTWWTITIYLYYTVENVSNFFYTQKPLSGIQATEVTNVKQFVPMLWASSNTTTDVFSSSLETRSAILGSRR